MPDLERGKRGSCTPPQIATKIHFEGAWRYCAPTTEKHCLTYTVKNVFLWIIEIVLLLNVLNLN